MILALVPLVFLLAFVLKWGERGGEAPPDGTEVLEIGGIEMLVLPIFAIWAGLRYFVLSVNRRKDEEIRAACERLSRACGELTVTYRAENTGFLKRRHAQTLRGVF